MPSAARETTDGAARGGDHALEVGRAAGRPCTTTSAALAGTLLRPELVVVALDLGRPLERARVAASRALGRGRTAEAHVESGLRRRSQRDVEAVRLEREARELAGGGGAAPPGRRRARSAWPSAWARDAAAPRP